MAECLLGQPSWRVDMPTGLVGFGHTVAEACSAVAAMDKTTTAVTWSGTQCMRASSPMPATQVCTPYVLPPYIPSSGAGPVTAACTASAPCVVTLPPDGSDILYGAMWALGVVILFALGYTGGRAR